MPTIAGERRFTRSDRATLDVIATQVGATAAMVRTTVELRRSRVELLIAREEERRRIRRDLHDGLGPSLAGLAHRIERIRRSVPADLDAVEQDLTAVERDVRAALEDVRRVARGLRPPVLDQLGLAGAIELRAEELGLDPVIDSSAPNTLPAAVELAAYLISSEAILNAKRHGHATAVRVNLVVTAGALHLDVTDNGIGIAREANVGIGLHSMHRRAAELGGRCAVTAANGTGTTVSIVMPLPSDTSR